MFQALSMQSFIISTPFNHSSCKLMVNIQLQILFLVTSTITFLKCIWNSLSTPLILDMEKTPVSLSSFSFHTSLVEYILSQIGSLPFSVYINSIITYLSPYSRSQRPCKQLNYTLTICVGLILLLLTSVKSPSQIIYSPVWFQFVYGISTK